MDNEYFEMNELDATHFINAEQDSYREPDSRQSSESDDSGNRTNRQPVADRAVSQPVADRAVKTAAAEGKTNGKQADAKKIGKMLVALVLLGALTIAVAGAVIIGFALNKKDDGYDEKYDLKETVFVTDSDSPGIELISENVLGTGMLFEDCDILSSPEENAAVEGRLAGGTDVLVYAAEGDYYKVSDAEKNVIGYVLKEKVNTGNIDLGNPDADAEIVDDATGKVVGKEKTKSKKNTNSKEETVSVNPEDFPVNASPYFIYVEKGSHTITIFGKDKNGKYTVPRKTFLTATGRTAALTPVGDFTILGKEKWHSWGNAYSPYCCKYYGNLFFHGPIYGEKNFGTLSVNSVYAIGTNASSGCLRTTAQAAYFIYQFCWVGTNVKIVNGSPLGRSASLPSYWSQYVDPATNSVPVAGLSFGFSDRSMNVGDSLKVTPDFTPSSASNQDCTWSSSNAGIVSVEGNGESCVIRALKPGSAVITACSVDGQYTASFRVTVLSVESEIVSSQIVSDVSSEITSSVQSDDVSSAAVSSQDTSSQDTSSQDTSSQETSSQETSSQETSSKDDTSQDSSSETTDAQSDNP